MDKGIIKGNKKINIAVFVLILVCSLSVYLSKQFFNLDEIWNYCFSRGIAMGYVPYNDFNTVLPPWFYSLMSIPLMFSRTLLTYRITGALIVAITLYFVYKSLVGHINIPTAVISPLFLLLFIESTLTYNGIVLLCAVILLLIHDKDKTSAGNFHFFLMGLVAAMPVMFRQTTGVVILLFELFYVIYSGNKKGKRTLMFLSGAAVTCLGLLAYLLINKNFWGYWENCLFSLLRVDSQNSSNDFEWGHIPEIAILLGAVIQCILLFMKSKNKEYIYNILSIAGVFTVAVPIADPGHIFPSVIIACIVLIRNNARKIPAFSKIFYGLVIGIICLMIIGTSLSTVITSKYTDDMELKYIPLLFSLDGHKEIIAKNEEYHDMGFDTVIISESKAIFSIIDGSFQAPYHFSGMRNPVEYIEGIPSGTIVIISDTYKEDNWQNPPEVYDYVIDNYELIDRYSNYGYYLVP